LICEGAPTWRQRQAIYSLGLGFESSLDSDYDPGDYLDEHGRIIAPEGAEAFLAKHMHQEPIEVVYREPLRSELEAFLAAARGQRPPAVSGIQGRRAIAAAETVIEKIRKHRQRLSEPPRPSEGIA